MHANSQAALKFRGGVLRMSITSAIFMATRMECCSVAMMYSCTMRISAYALSKSGCPLDCHSVESSGQNSSTENC